MQILGIIPARGGSKGVLGKNKKLLGGRPLISYTIMEAKASSLSDVILSTDDPEIMDIGRQLGLEVPFQRPDYLALDNTPSVEVVQHALDFLEDQGRSYEAVCLLQPTNPFRTAETISQAIEKYKEGIYDAVISVLLVPHQFNPHWVFEEGENGLKVSTGDELLIQRRQELPNAYYRDGSIYITDVPLLRRGHFIGKRTGYVIADASRHVNIDTQEDWEKAEQLLKSMSY